jgi:hypothetical protein
MFLPVGARASNGARDHPVRGPLTPHHGGRQGRALPRSRFPPRQTASPNQGFVFGISKFWPDERVVACLRYIP